MSVEFNLTPALLAETEVINAMERSGAPYGHKEPSDFYATKIDHARKFPSSPHVKISGGEAAVGKTTENTQDAIDEITTLLGDQVIVLDGRNFQTEQGVIIPRTGSWGDSLHQAEKMGKLQPKEFGKWSPEDLTINSTHVKQTISSEAKPNARIKVDMPVVTAAFLDQGTDKKLIGHDRGLSTIKQLFEDPKLSPHLFVAFFVTDTDSLKRRLKGRDLLKKVDTTKELKKWLKKQNVVMREQDLESMLQYAPNSSATLHAANVMRLHANQVMLDPQYSEQISLTSDEIALLKKENELLQAGVPIIDSRILKGHEKRNEILVHKFYPDILKQIGIPEDRALIGLNTDVQHVHWYPGIMLRYNMFTREQKGSLPERIIRPARPTHSQIHTELKTVVDRNEGDINIDPNQATIIHNVFDSGDNSITP